MGVNGLWQLLSPYGRRVAMETLDRKVGDCGRAGDLRCWRCRAQYNPAMAQTLAIDVSIWLVQFVKAMRDDEGKMVRHAHLIGTFRRIIKVAYFPRNRTQHL